MNKCAPNLNFIHFADDTSVTFSGSDLSNVYDTMNSELIEVDRWLCCNKLSLNVNKSAFMIFSNRDRESNKSVYIRGAALGRVECTKFLGVIIDDKFSFSRQTDFVRSKIAKSCGILYRLSHYMPDYVLKNIYLSLVYPYLHYCIITWGNSSQTQLRRLQSKVNKCIKLANPSIKTLNVLECHINGFLNVRDIFIYSTLIKFYKYFKLNWNKDFCYKIQSLKIPHTHSTRFICDNKLILPFYSKAKAQNSFIYSSIKFWNSLNADTRNSNSLFKFKKQLKAKILANYNLM